MVPCRDRGGKPGGQLHGSLSIKGTGQRRGRDKKANNNGGRKMTVAVVFRSASS